MPYALPHLLVYRGVWVQPSVLVVVVDKTQRSGASTLLLILVACFDDSRLLVTSKKCDNNLEVCILTPCMLSAGYLVRRELLVLVGRTTGWPCYGTRTDKCTPRKIDGRRPRTDSRSNRLDDHHSCADTLTCLWSHDWKQQRVLLILI